MLPGLTLLDLLLRHHPLAAVMTSPSNHTLLSQALAGKATCFMQSELPFLDAAKNPLPFSAPAGNGCALKHLVEKGIWDTWKQAGIEYVNVLNVDNILADPTDTSLAALAQAEGNEAVMRVIPRQNPQENVGVIVGEEGHWHIKEYTELTDQEKDLTQYLYASISFFCFSMSFIQKAAALSLPLHYVWKKIPGTSLSGWKCEYYIFDLLPYASRVGLQQATRETSFCPLKTPTDLPAVQQAARRLLNKI